MSGVHDDLATLREELNACESAREQPWVAHTALARVEAEIARLREERDAALDGLSDYREALLGLDTPADSQEIRSYGFDGYGRAYARYANGEVMPTGYVARSFAGKSDVTPERYAEIAADARAKPADSRAAFHDTRREDWEREQYERAYEECS